MPDFSTYEARQAYRDANPGAIVDASGAYFPKTNQQVSGGGDGGTAPADVSAIPQITGGLDQPSLQALTNFGNAAGTATAADLAERKRQFDASLEWQKQMWQNQGLPQLVIQQRAQQLQEQEFQFQMQMAQKNLGLQQQQLGADVLKTQASLGGPSNFVQAANYARGIRQTDIPSFMFNLLTGTSTAPTVGGVGLSAPETLTTLAQKAGAGGVPSGTPDMGTTLNMGRAIFAGGGGALGPQALEGLTDTEKQMLGSVGNAVGADVPGYMQQYARSRIAQQAAQAG